MSQKTEPLSLRWAQGQVFSCEKRFRVLVAGRRFGKSYLACVELLRGALDRPGETFFYCAPTYRMAKDIAWRVLKKLVPKVWIKTKNETDLRIELINGSTIELKGTENAMALRGRSLSGVVLDEAAFMDAEVCFAGFRGFFRSATGCFPIGAATLLIFAYQPRICIRAWIHVKLALGFRFYTGI